MSLGNIRFKILPFQPHCALDTIINQHPFTRPSNHISLHHINPFHPPLKHKHLNKPAFSVPNSRRSHHPMTAPDMLIQLVLPIVTVPAPRHRAAKDLGASLMDPGMAKEIRLTAERAMALRAHWTQWDGRSDVERYERTLGRRDEGRTLCCGLFIGVNVGSGGKGVVASGCSVRGQWMFDEA